MERVYVVKLDQELDGVWVAVEGSLKRIHTLKSNKAKSLEVLE